MFLPTLRRPHLRWMAWMTLLVVLLGALAPTVSRWVHTASSLPVPLALLEVCMTREDGPSRIGLQPSAESLADADAGTQPSPEGAGLHVDHCPFCLLQGEGHGMPPVDARASLPAQGADASVPALFLHAPRPLHAWAAAAPRGPPSLA